MFGDKLLICLVLFIGLIGTFIGIIIRRNRSHEFGKWAEHKVAIILSYLDKEYKVFNDVLIKNHYGSSQIDHLVVSPYGIFVIETKSYKGKIYGGDNSERWTQNLWGYRYSLPNPIRQNHSHIIALENTLPRFLDSQYISIVVFTSDCLLKTFDDDKHNVIYETQLISTITEYKNVVLTEQQQQEFIKVLQPFLTTSKEEKDEHISRTYQKDLQRNQLLANHKCPRCGGDLVYKKGKFGMFYGCSNYPNCTFTCKAFH